MTTLTVFCYGTGENRRQTNNIITQFYNACSNTQDTICIDGPGLLGTEVRSLANNATNQIIKWLQTQPEDAHEINLTGYSRGAIASTYIANNLKRVELALLRKERILSRRGKELISTNKKLLNQLQKINLNLFLMDPVAGMGKKGSMDGRVIPDNVKNYVAVLQMDERRRDFKPQDMSRIIIQSPEKTQVSILPMYGNHSDATKIKSDEMNAAPEILWYSLHQFLTEHGTTFTEARIPQIVYQDHYKAAHDIPPINSASELLQLFSTLHEKRDAYLQSGKEMRAHDGIPVPRVQRRLNNHLNLYVKNPEFFINQLERELFKITYPKVFNYLFEQNQFDLRFPEDSSSTQEQIEKELHRLKTENEKLFLRLESREIREENGVLSVGAPGGTYTLEPCLTLTQLFPNFITNDLIKQKLPNKLASLEQQSYRLALQYQREKPSIKFFAKRSKDWRASDILQRINTLIEHENLCDDEKYFRLLDILEKHYKQMVQEASSSELALMLRDLLARHQRHFEIVDPGITRALLSTVIHAVLSLLKEVISFAGNLGYIGGGALFTLGFAIEEFGRRINEIIEPLGSDPLKYLLCALAYTMQGTGFAIKNSFGLKPLTAFITSGISYIRDAANKAILDIKIQPKNSTLRVKQTLQEIHSPDSTEDSPLNSEDQGNTLSN
ncbi:DUF5621 domain-containing protein [Legionella worsleiensis]|uniref:Dot/Icm T4SS effector n=1 Tax=Legionella worsleiensis TaxID=45076 RepID=A0A0W1AIX2_9GAMM|nr:DUF5621 domain-containing protein [Legionella worsleiensis]KTD81266.1 Dot/Icm T4SS effector [Legionella worsleiensis]STY30867.1 Dot/Icm T4SS effector [Legionella worsleiensis]